MRKPIWRAAGLAAAFAAFLGVDMAVAPVYADALRTYDVDDYVQDGLVGHFDAIRNVSANAPHSMTAGIWKNLAGGPDAEFQYRAGSTPDSVWTDKSFFFKEDAMATTVDTLDLGTNFTVQIAITATPSAQTQSTVGGKKDGSKYNCWFNDNPKNNYGFWTEGNLTKLVGNFNPLKTAPEKDVRPSISSWGGRYVTWMLDGANGLCWTFETDTIPDGTILTVVSTKPQARKYCWGAEKTGNGALQAFLTGEYHSVRIYDRVLTEDEIRQNRIVDEARYRSEATKGRLPNLIVVGMDAARSNEKYLVTGSETFSLPESTVTTAKGIFVSKGYRLETWDAESESWINSTETANATSCEITGADIPQRLTWLWNAALRTYDVDDYVQDGLVGHFDAIRNIGADAPHSMTASIWKNLAGGPDAEFQYRAGSTPDSVWTDKSFFFKEDAMATTVDTLDLGTNFTVQIAITATPSAQTQSTVGGIKDGSGYNAWFNDNPKNDYGFWTRGSSSDLVGNFNPLKTAPEKDVRPSISSWSGRYVTWMLDGANGLSWTFETDTIPDGTSLTVVSKYPDPRKYCWGAEDKNGNGSLQAFLTGEYHSVRIYTNTLDAAQIKLNRQIDDLRFRGIGDVTIVNGAVGETGAVGASSVPDGVYNLEADSWTFTAPNVKVNGRIYEPQLLVETWNGSAWVMESKRRAATYTLGKSGTSRVRLTWSWKAKLGLAISIR